MRDGTALGTVRCIKGDVCKIGRLAVVKEARGLHLGQSLVREAERLMQEKWDTKVILISSQHQVEGFYKTLGYERTEKEYYMDEGWKHCEMTKTLM